MRQWGGGDLHAAKKEEREREGQGLRRKRGVEGLSGKTKKGKRRERGAGAKKVGWYGEKEQGVMGVCTVASL